MRHWSKRKYIIMYTIVATVFCVAALVVNRSDYTWGDIVLMPFVWISKTIRELGQFNMTAAYAVYITICLLPIVWPLICLIRTKKFHVRYIPWVALSGMLFVMMYFFINPHKIQLIWFVQNISEQTITESRNIILLGMVVTAFAMLIFCFLCEFVRELKRKESSVYRYAKILFELVIICVLFDIFFMQTVKLRDALNGLPQDNDLNNPMGINVALNVFAIIASFVFRVAPSVIAVVLLWQSKCFVGALQEEMLSPSHIATLKTISKISVLTIFCALGSMIIENILLLALSGNLLNAYFNVEIPIGMLLVTCLILIFSKIMLKSTVLNEESKLVI